MERLEKVVVLDNEVLAELVDSILTEREIPHLMRSYRDSVYDGLFQTAAGWGHIEAPPEYHAQVMAVLDEIEQHAEQISDEEYDGSGTEDDSFEE
ncbi:MAG: hypothetical protein WC655_20175 [Candidatus Hydrogenedentales bacterium]